jgi:MoaA/NifB/PqqE/SkfB family radical SAM enzyme
VPALTAVPGGLLGLAYRFIDVQRARRSGMSPATLPLLSIEVTRDCNATCGMCGYPTDYPMTRPPLDTASLFAIIDEARTLGTLVISLGGGELFLRRDAEALIDRVLARGMTALVHTNGALLTPRRVARLATKRGLVMSFSVDASQRQAHDRERGVACFDRIMAASSALANAGQARVAWICTVTRHNAGDLLPIMQLAHDVGVRTVRFTPVHANLQHRYKAGSLVLPYRVPAPMLPALRAQIAAVLDFSRRARMVTNSRAFLNALPDAFAGRIAHRCYAGFFFYVLDPAGQLMPCYDHPTGVFVDPAGGLRAALAAPAMTAAREKVLACSNACWNIGTAEPSLRIDPRRLPGNAAQLAREALFFLRPQ